MESVVNGKFLQGDDGWCEPVEAYDRIAPFFSQIADRRKAYLRAIEQMIVERVPRGSESLLDVGAGDGTRALKIADSAGLTKVALVEPSAGMIEQAASRAEIWPMRAEELELTDSRPRRMFNVITCLWNVLGHIREAHTRRDVLQYLAGLLAPGGTIFIDVTHRYNARSYGWAKTMGRFIYDELLPSCDNGDVTVTWTFDGVRCSTFGHVFTHQEVRDLVKLAGLEIGEMAVVDYESGAQCRFIFQGNLFYVLRRPSLSTNSSREEQTSSTSASVS